MDRHAYLTALLARIDQQIAEAELLIDRANMPVEDWFLASDTLCALERAKQDVESKLRDSHRLNAG